MIEFRVMDFFGKKQIKETWLSVTSGKEVGLKLAEVVRNGCTQKAWEIQKLIPKEQREG